MKRFAVLAALILTLTGCASFQEKPAETVFPPLPKEVDYLWEYYGKPETYPAVATTMVWKCGQDRLHLTLTYDQFLGWLVMGYKIKGNRTVPDEVEMYMYMAVRKCGLPPPGWGGAVPRTEGKTCKRREF